ncbi:MAG: hypothetical protein Q8M01_07255 [Rubrivivax sp.]|nr:hypothetical protein [Rubrivivax sp.]
MGKWAERLAEKTAAPPYGGTDKTAKRGVLSVLAVTPEGGAEIFFPAPMPASKPTESPEALDLAAVAWTDGDIARFLDRRARLLRWGWPEPEAEKLADRLVRRDREADDRVSCTDCRHYRPGRCGNHRQAGLHAPDVERDLAAMLQRCPGFDGAKHPRNGPPS